MALPLGPVIETREVSRAERRFNAVVFVIGLGAAVAPQVWMWVGMWDQFTLGPGKSGLVSSWCLLAIPIDLIAIGLWWRWGRRSIGRSVALAGLTAPVWFLSIFFALVVIGPIRVFLWHVFVSG